MSALDAAGPPWRLVLTSPSLSGLWAAAEGGLGLTARTAPAMPTALSALNPVTTGLPTLPSVPLTIHYVSAELTPAVARLKTILLDALGAQMIEMRAESMVQDGA